MKSLSILPDLAEGAYEQMPLETITKPKYEELRRALRPVRWDALTGSDGQDSVFCTNDSCEV